MAARRGERRLVIVGGGASGVAAFVAAVRYGVARSIELVDPRGIGRSTAFAAKHPALLCNTSVETMSIVDDDPDDFLAYLQLIGVMATRDGFVPRAYVSGYLASRYDRYAALARASGIEHRLVTAAALRIERMSASEYRVVLENGVTLPATDVLICTGHGAPYVPDAVRPHLGKPLLFESLYPEAHVLAELEARSRVLVLGSRLSALDSALLLCAAGHSIDIVSPSGRLPAVRTATPRACPVPVDAAALARLDLDCAAATLSWRLLRIVARAARAVHKRPLSAQVERAREPIERMRREAELARRGATDWQEILVAHMDAAQIRLHDEPVERQRHALAECSRVVGRYLFACPLQSADALIEYAQAQRLTVSAATPAALHRGARWTVRWDDGGLDEYDAIVCATGFCKAPLYASAHAVALGEQAVGAGESLRVGPDLRVSLPGLAHPERIWTLGLASQSGAPIVNAVYQAVRQAHELCRSWQAADAADALPRFVAEEAE
ncbi:MAG: FAD/NAD(P)-binding protein [Paraburkholderia sp.]|nr:MAG: FAD/NAD(P)-binding protein [Paraburkholderia sp.]